MAQISKHALHQEAHQRLFNELARYIGVVNKNNAPMFLQSFLTPTEQTMLAKRIGVVVLLHNDISTYQIMKKLHMSSATVIRMHKEYTKGSYNAITKLFAMNKKDRTRFLNILEIVLQGGLPPRAGKRWTFLRESFGHTMPPTKR